MFPAKGNQLGASFYGGLFFKHDTKIELAMTGKMTSNRGVHDFSQL